MDNKIKKNHGGIFGKNDPRTYDMFFGIPFVPSGVSGYTKYDNNENNILKQNECKTSYVDRYTETKQVEKYDKVKFYRLGKEYQIGEERSAQDIEIITNWLSKNINELIDVLNGDKQ